MKFCINCPNSFQIPAISQPWQAKMTGREIANAIELVDAPGYDIVNIGEHFIVPDAHFSLSGGHYLHGTVALGFLAGHTKRTPSRLRSHVVAVAASHRSGQSLGDA
jgi:alkanesulfonate monooxygenase SsuD/methylene tetrahydromethanopterin reductase-like flavin-dependent oxidoreductase (luciferase family)